MKYGIYIGARVGVVAKLGKVVMAVLASPAADEVKLKALDVIQHATSISGVSIANTSIVGKPANGTS